MAPALPDGLLVNSWKAITLTNHNQDLFAD